jgi:hypothetical protein
VNKILKSRLVSILALVIVVLYIIITFRLITEWWLIIDKFFAYMAAFAHFAALYMEKFSFKAYKKLDKVAFWCTIIFVISLVVEILYTVI